MRNGANADKGLQAVSVARCLQGGQRKNRKEVKHDSFLVALGAGITGYGNSAIVVSDSTAGEQGPWQPTCQE